MLNKPETQDKTRNARLEARVSSDQKDFFQRAANLTGRTLSELVIDSTQEAAEKIVQEHEVIRLLCEKLCDVPTLFEFSFYSRQMARLWTASRSARCLYFYNIDHNH